MKIVIDANVVIAMLIRPGKPLELLFDDRLQIVAPNRILEEIENNIDLIELKSNVGHDELREFLEIIKERITIISESEFKECKHKAIKICPDPKDVIYFALALYLKCPLWSNDKLLSKQNIIKVILTHDLLSLLT